MLDDGMQPMMDTTSELEQSLHLVEHGVHIAVMLVLLLLAVLGTFFLVRYFLRPVTTKGLGKRVVSSVLRSAIGSGNGKVEPALAASVTEESDTFVVIPDISGYTRYMSLNRFSVGHAQYVISQLLNAMIDAVRPVLNPTHIEGDAIIFYAVSSANGSTTGVSGDRVSLVVVDLLNAFYAERLKLQDDNACPCHACQHIDNLNLKVIVHYGPLLHSKLKTFENLSGMAVIAGKRLLKNSLAMDRYVLVTDAAARVINLPLPVIVDEHREIYDDIGSIGARVYGFEPEQMFVELKSERRVPLPAQMRDAMRKLVENARTLRQSAGPSI